MTNGNLDELIARAEVNWGNVVQGHPESNEFGFFSYGDAPGGLGGGAGSFVWFADRDAMLDFIENTLPYSPPGRNDKDWTDVATQTSSIVEEMRLGKINDVTAIERLNSVLKTFSQIEWIGTFDELKSSNQQYPIEVRSAFYGGEVDSEDPAPLTAGEVENFKDFLAEWGN